MLFSVGSKNLARFYWKRCEEVLLIYCAIKNVPVHFALMQNEPPKGIPAGKRSRL